jgi:hypothetical protein
MPLTPYQIRRKQHEIAELYFRSLCDDIDRELAHSRFKWMGTFSVQGIDPIMIARVVEAYERVGWVVTFVQDPAGDMLKFVEEE